jgi:hypothetical protein
LNARRVCLITPSVNLTKQNYQSFCDFNSAFLVQRGIISVTDAEFFYQLSFDINVSTVPDGVELKSNKSSINPFAVGMPELTLIERKWTGIQYTKSKSVE